MINLLSAATSTPKHSFKTTELTNSLMHKLSPELINTLNSLGVDQRYSVMDNYPDFLEGAATKPTSSTTALGVDATKRCVQEWGGDPSQIGLLIAATNTPDQMLPCLASEVMAQTHGLLSRSLRTVNMQAQGCSVLLKSVEVAQWYLAANPNKLAIVLMAVFADVIQTHDPIATEAADTLARPSATHWLGTDHLGRDIYSRIIHGARVSLMVGVGSTIVASLFGGIIGLLSGYIGGKTDLAVQRVMDILQGLPLLVLALVMSAALGPSIQNVILAISIPIMPRAARVIRASVLSIREFQYVEAARALGVSHLRVAFRHILPNTVGPFIVLATAQLGSAILVEATLSFLGLGVPEPYPSWGRMLSVSAAEYAQKAPHLVLFPGIAISLAVFGSNLLGDALRDTLDPRLRGA